MSLHRGNGFFPSRPDMGAKDVGIKSGRGFNVNIEWTKIGMGNREYRAACERVLFPIAKEYDPELIIVSCGFDSALHDQLGQMKVSPIMYYWMTKQLIEICPRVLVCQEGGYNTDYLGQHASGVVKALLGQEYSDPI